MTTETENKENTSEEQLITRAQDALSSCNWVIGECASEWTQKYSKGRTDADFGSLIGLSGDQVYQRRRVWETFADVNVDYPNLKWSHFYVAVNWEDAAECLQWANEIEATVAEMKAWRRSQHGEDLSEPGEEVPFDIAPDYLSSGSSMVRDPNEFAVGGPSDGSGGVVALVGPNGERAATADSAARDSGNSDYAPFSPDARGPADNKEKADRPEPTSEQIIKRATSMLQKVATAITPAVLEDFPDLPLDVQERFLTSVENLRGRTDDMS